MSSFGQDMSQVVHLLKKLMLLVGLSTFTACGGIGDGVVDLRNGNSLVGCEETVEDTISTGTLTSKDGQATLKVTGLPFPVNLTLTVDCTDPQTK